MIIFRIFFLLMLSLGLAHTIAAPLNATSDGGPVIIYTDDFGRLSADVVNSSLHMEASPGTQVQHIQVVSAMGTVSDLSSPELPYDWNTSELPEGTYTIWATTTVQTYSVTFTVEH